MATAIRDLVERTRTMVFGSVPDPLVRLANDRAAGGDEITLSTTIHKIAPGSLVSCGLNTFYVELVSGDTIRVIPSADGGPDTACMAGEILRVAPRATTFTIFAEIRDAIVDMASPRNGLYRPLQYEKVRTGFDGVYSYPQGWYDALVQPSKFIGAWYQSLGGGQDWTRVFSAEWMPEEYAVKILEEPESARNYRFIFGFPYYAPTDIDDALFDLGLTEASTQGIPMLRAAARLSMSQEAMRNQLKSQGDSRRPSEVPPRAHASLADEWMRQYEEQINAERSRLNSLFPYTMRIGDEA